MFIFEIKEQVYVCRYTMYATYLPNNYVFDYEMMFHTGEKM